MADGRSYPCPLPRYVLGDYGLRPYMQLTHLRPYMLNRHAHNPSPQVDRNEVDCRLDSYTSEMELPGFELKLKWTLPDRPPEFFDHALELHGAKGAKGAIHFNLCIGMYVTVC